MTGTGLDRLPTAGPFPETWRLIPSRYPTIQAFDTVASAGDLDAVMALEGWTNDRLVRHRLHRLPEDQRVLGRSNAGVILAAFLHPSPDGARFSDAQLGAWYASLAEKTAIKEVAHHLRREAHRAGQPEIVSQYRAYQAHLAGDHVDIRGRSATLPDVYRPDDYAAGQAFGAQVRASPHAGIVYDSVRDPAGTNVVSFRPPAVRDVVQRRHFELTVPRNGRIIVRHL